MASVEMSLPNFATTVTVLDWKSDLEASAIAASYLGSRMTPASALAAATSGEHK
jgi:hypothetical protein